MNFKVWGPIYFVWVKVVDEIEQERGGKEATNINSVNRS